MAGQVILGDIVRRKSRTANTAPGPNGLPYYAIEKADPGGIVLQRDSVFVWLRPVSLGEFGRAWEESNTILIRKTGE